MANQGKRMVKENLIAQISQGGGSEYTAGNGINIAEDVISVDTDTIATKAELGSFAESFGGELNNILNTGTSVVQRAKNDENGNEIDTTYATKSELNAVDAKTIPTYGLEWADAGNYDTRYTMAYDFQTLINAGMPILGTTTETETNYPDSYIVLPKGSIFKVKGYFAIKRQSGGYQVFAAADKSSNRLNQYFEYNAVRVTSRIMNVDNARPNALVTFTPTAEEIALGVSSTIVPLTGSGNAQTALSGETADDSYNSLKTAYLKISLAHPTPNVRYDNQIAVPSDRGGFLYAHPTNEVLAPGVTQFEWAQPSGLPFCPNTNPDGTYVLEATVASGVVTYNWVLKQ